MTLKQYREKLMNGISILLFTAAGVLLFLYLILQVPGLRDLYQNVQQTLHEFEMLIASIEEKWIALLVLAVIFLLRSWLPVVPIAAICLITGMIFPMPYSFIINMSGLIIMFCVGYYRGIQQGGGAFRKFMDRYDGAWELVEYYGRGNPLLLFITRLAPVVPLNSTSVVYGSLQFPFFEYLFISLGGFAPRLIAYTFIGKNVFDPFSFAFIGPIVLLLTLFGAILLGLNKILAKISKSKKAQLSNQKKTDEKNKNTSSKL